MRRIGAYTTSAARGSSIRPFRAKKRRTQAESYRGHVPNGHVTVVSPKSPSGLLRARLGEFGIAIAAVDRASHINPPPEIGEAGGAGDTVENGRNSGQCQGARRWRGLAALSRCPTVAIAKARLPLAPPTGRIVTPTT